MRTLGLIGGMSWVSTRSYLEQINRLTQRRTSPRTTAPLLAECQDFGPLHGDGVDADWDKVADRLASSAKRLEQAGAGALVICANAMHRHYDLIADAVDIPVIHAADAIGKAVAATNQAKLALIGRRSVMTESFFRERIVAHGVDLMAPDMANVDQIEQIIDTELMVGKASRDAERKLKSIITNRQQAGATGIVLACTELELVVDVDANVLPIFDSTRIHCQAAVEWMFEDA